MVPGCAVLQSCPCFAGKRSRRRRTPRVEAIDAHRPSNPITFGTKFDRTLKHNTSIAVPTVVVTAYSCSGMLSLTGLDNTLKYNSTVCHRYISARHGGRFVRPQAEVPCLGSSILRTWPV